MASPRRFDVFDLTRLVTIGVAATLAACVEDPTTNRDTAALGSESGSGGEGSGCLCATPARLDLTLDRSTITTELASANTIVVTLTAANGFGGPATLSGSIRDPNGNPLPGWAVTFDTTILYLPQNGTATAIATVAIPSENRGLIGTARIEVASNAPTGIHAAETTLIAANQITLPIGIEDNQCVYPSPAPNTVAVSIGTKLRWLNKPTNTWDLTIHVDSNPYGVYHQPNFPPTAPGQVYEQTVTGSPSTRFRWYCHAPGPAADNYIQPVD